MTTGVEGHGVVVLLVVAMVVVVVVVEGLQAKNSNWIAANVAPAIGPFFQRAVMR